MADDKILKDCGCECGCSVEIGTVITDKDTVYDFNLTGTKEEVEARFNAMVEAAKKADATVKIDYQDSTEAEFARKGTFTFSCSAEKMIFQLNANAL